MGGTPFSHHASPLRATLRKGPRPRATRRTVYDEDPVSYEARWRLPVKGLVHMHARGKEREGPGTPGTAHRPRAVQEVGSDSGAGIPWAAWRAESALLKRVRSAQNTSRSSGAHSCVSSAIN